VESLETGTSLYKNPGQPERKKNPMTKQYRKESLFWLDHYHQHKN